MESTKLRKRYSRWISDHKRLAIYIRDSFICAKCKRDLRSVAAFEITLDHLVPVSRNGSNDACNLVTACRSCNSARGAKSWVKFYGEENVVSIKNATRRKLNIELARSLTEGVAA